MFNSIIDVIENTVEQFGNKIAVIDPERKLTWAELRNEALKISDLIIDKTHPKKGGFPIAVFSLKNVSLFASVMGITYSGGFYVYINPEQSNERIKTILEVLNPLAVLVEDVLLERFDSIDVNYTVLTFSNDNHTTIKTYSAKPQTKADRATPLYGMFTSGSTGIPKCVLVSHGAAIDFITHFTEIFGFNDKDVIGNQAPFDFDVSIKDIVTAYFTGATVVLIPTEYFVTPAKLLDYLTENKVTSLTWAVSALCLVSGLKGFSYKKPTGIKRVMFSGEVMPAKHLAIWQENLPDARFVNLYGPSEITCNCTYYEINEKALPDTRLPLGKPFPGRIVRLLGDDGYPVNTPGQTGEICVSGESIAIGYYHDPIQTEKVFTMYLEPDGSVLPMYKTGDLATIGDDGELYFAGRKDFQIKYMGHRIELEEVETGINSVEGVERCICSYDHEKSKLYGYYTGSLDCSSLREILKEKFPAFMIPGKLYHVKSFIINKNGKTDRSKLKELEVL